jgi:hypothetical protein
MPFYAAPVLPPFMDFHYQGLETKIKQIIPFLLYWYLKLQAIFCHTIFLQLRIDMVY